ncbi:alpha/beta hydrolase [Natronorubrum aibiense]|uniref:Alpha/beta hydrolase n=1 Tax=Natronorubrum aibiense TaxID=348826 RepID=A0A5P9P9B1_9EURY|nr:alpha/beta hydrolase [Natronorubrum aibiense]QFU84702.1 alpha/beta hydrolase [Natronorubrum aibiense]
MRLWKQTVVIVLVVFVLVVGGVSIYFSMPYHGTQTSIQSVENNPDVTISIEDDVTVLAPEGEPSSVGLVFYPGARVAPDAYYSSLAPLVTEANVTVFIPEMPLNIALLDAGAAGDIRTQQPTIQTWFVGGHSLGGVAACQYTESNDVHGLVLFASYCNTDVSDRPMTALSVTGSADGVLDRDAYRENQEYLPPTSATHEIQGMNHTQFGSYHGQRGDSPASLSYDEAHRRLAEIVVPWIADVSERTRSSSSG